MPFYQFPRKILFQRDILNDIDQTLKDENINRILIVTDKIVRKLVENKISSLSKNFSVRVFDDVEVEPSVSKIEEASKTFNKEIDAIMAIGGGSVIDFAKSLRIKITYPEKDLRDVNPFEKLDFKIKMIAVPTTSGTGSDVSFGIVLSDEDRKLALANYNVVPDIVILDSSITPNVKKIVSSTGVDALVHSFEAIASNTSSVLTDALAERAIENIFNNIEKSIDGNEDAKDLMHISATMAGIAFSNSGTALAHALGHSFGSTFHVTHGVSVGLFLTHTIEFNSNDEATRRKYERIAKRLNYEDIQSLIEGIMKLFRRIGQPVQIRELGIKREEYNLKIDEMVKKALMDSEIAFNPVIAGEEDLRKIFLNAY